MDPNKVSTVWQVPATRKQLQSFLGFANFYRQFIPVFTQIALPLTDLLRTKGHTIKIKASQCIVWTDDCQRAFDALKALFAQEPIMQHPNQLKPFIVQADASDVAIRAVLMQSNEAGQLQPCAYTSKKITPTERGWAIMGKRGICHPLGSPDVATYSRRGEGAIRSLDGS